MLRDRLLQTMTALNLSGMKAVLDETLATAQKQRATPEKMLLDFLEAELAERKVRSIRYRLSLAVPVAKDLDHFDFASSPVDETQVRALYDGRFLSDKATSS